VRNLHNACGIRIGVLDIDLERRAAGAAVGHRSGESDSGPRRVDADVVPRNRPEGAARGAHPARATAAATAGGAACGRGCRAAPTTTTATSTASDDAGIDSRAGACPAGIHSGKCRGASRRDASWARRVGTRGNSASRHHQCDHRLQTNTHESNSRDNGRHRCDRRVRSAHSPSPPSKATDVPRAAAASQSHKPFTASDL
jgi:hypothetical protein